MRPRWHNDVTNDSYEHGFDPRHATRGIGAVSIQMDQGCVLPLQNWVEIHAVGSCGISSSEFIKKNTRGSKVGEPGLCLACSLRKPDAWSNQRMNFEWCQHEQLIQSSKYYKKLIFKTEQYFVNVLS